MKHNLQDKLIEKVLNDERKDEKTLKFLLLLTTELQDKYRVIENTKDNIDKKINNNWK